MNLELIFNLHINLNNLKFNAYLHNESITDGLLISDSGWKSNLMHFVKLDF